MGHLASGGVYGRLRRRLDRMPVGAPDRPALRQILRILFTEDEAGLAAAMPMRFATAAEIAARAGRPAAEVTAALERMAGKGTVLDFGADGGPLYYVLCPTVVGFFELSMMRIRQDYDQAALARLYHEYMFEDPENTFLRQVSTTRFGLFRTLVHETALPEGSFAEVLDYERASEAIRSAGAVGLSVCHCRHVKAHLGRRCQVPLEFCMSLGQSGDWLARRGLGREIAREEALELLDRARQLGLVQIGDNVQRRVSFICNCCACCCGVLEGYRRIEMPAGATHTSNFIAVVDEAVCTGCGRCIERCPIEALALAPLPEAREAAGPGVEAEPGTAARDGAPPARAPRARRVARLDAHACLGCGVCIPACRPGALRLQPRPARVHTPEDVFERIFLHALESGKLQNFLVDGPERLDVRAARIILGLFLRAPGVRRALLSEPVRSRYFQRVADMVRRRPGSQALD